jgi:hypothetical protein
VVAHNPLIEKDYYNSQAALEAVRNLNLQAEEKKVVLYLFL